MSVEIMTYDALGARLNISAEAARSLAKRLRLPRSLSEHGRALVRVDFAELRHAPQQRSSRQAGNNALLAAQVEALQAGIARLETSAASHRADYEQERDRADRLMVELLRATAETAAAREKAARLEGEVAALRTAGRTEGPIDGQGQGVRRVGQLAASLVESDRKAARG